MERRVGLLESYVRGAWFVKIRLMSSRRQLWANEVSLIHLENASLQLRKICEMLGYMCIAAAGVEGFAPSKSIKPYKFSEVVSHLKKSGFLRFPRMARLERIDSGGDEPGVWNLTVTETSEDQLNRFGSIYKRSHRVLHEMSPSDFFASKDESLAALSHALNGMRADHQWLWNHLWQHAIFLDDRLFFVNLGDCDKSDRPQILKYDTLIAGDIEVDFDPDFLADFSGAVNWEQFSER